MEEYINLLKKMIGENKYKELQSILYADIKKKFPKLYKQEIQKRIEYNAAILLIIGIEVSKNKEQNLNEIIAWYNICPTSYLVNLNSKDFSNRYNCYIRAIRKKVEEDYKNQKIEI